jgi:hypothetical protein
MKIDLISSNAQLQVLSGALAVARPRSSELEKFQNRNMQFHGEPRFV